MRRSWAASTPASELTWLRPLPRGTSTSFGTTRTGHPARSAAVVPVTESSTARQSSGARSQQLRCPPVRVRCRFAAPHLVAAYRGREVFAANPIQRTLGEGPLCIGNQRHRCPFGGKLFQQLVRPVAPRQAVIEQLGGVVVQPPARLGHRVAVDGQAEVRVDDQHGVLGNAADHRGTHGRRQLAAQLLVQRRQRDVPHLFGVDKGAVHIPQDSLHELKPFGRMVFRLGEHDNAVTAQSSGL